MKEIRRGEIWWVSLDPTQGSEIRKTRPCLVLTTDILNHHRNTVVVIPLSTSAKPHPPITIPIHCGEKSAVAIIDQVRAVSKHRLKSKIEDTSFHNIQTITAALASILEIF